MVEIEQFGGVTVPDCDIVQSIKVDEEFRFDVDLGEAVEDNVVDYDEYEERDGKRVDIYYRDRVWWKQPISSRDSVVREITYKLSMVGDMDVMGATQLAEGGVSSQIDVSMGEGESGDLGIEVRLTSPDEADKFVDTWEDKDSYDRRHFNMARRAGTNDVIVYRDLMPTDIEELEEVYSTIREEYSVTGMVLVCQVPGGSGVVER